MCLPWHNAELARLLARHDRMPHALLLYGRQGIGKHAFALALAQAWLCEAPRAGGSACGQCIACGWCEGSSHPDWLRLEPAGAGGADHGGGDGKSASQITVEQVRRLPDFVNITSHRGGRKIVVVHPAEALNISAANALLKNLEEPPFGTHFLLVSHRPQFLPATIKSRCQLLPLAAPPVTAAEAWLRAQNVSDPALALAQTGNAPLLAVALTDADWWQRRETLLEAISNRQFDPLTTADAMRDVPLQDLVGWLQKWTYDLILGKFLGKVRYNPDYASAVTENAKNADTWSLLRFHREVLGMQRVVDHPLNLRLAAEDLLLGYARVVRANGLQEG